MEVTLLADHPQEVDTIAQWYYQEWAHISPDVSEEMVREKVAAKAINRDQIPLALVVHDNNQLVGVAELKYRENLTHPDYEHWLGGVFVESSKRGQGIASLLIREALKKSIALDIKKLYLQCEFHNISLYKNHGFDVLHRVVSDEIATTIMVWSAEPELVKQDSDN